jgi:hypothetical protein
VADAAAELHARELAHGAISPLTVLLTLKGKAKLDRLADPSIASAAPNPADDLRAIGDLLDTMVGKNLGAGIAGLQALEVIVKRARAGGFDSAAALAAMLRRI